MSMACQSTLSSALATRAGRLPVPSPSPQAAPSRCLVARPRGQQRVGLPCRARVSVWVPHGPCASRGCLTTGIVPQRAPALCSSVPRRVHVDLSHPALACGLSTTTDDCTAVAQFSVSAKYSPFQVPRCRAGGRPPIRPALNHTCRALGTCPSSKTGQNLSVRISIVMFEELQSDLVRYT
ncbi:uncharacterized protein B0I36DRAFT_49287 [Microdochium trichocladiopsis]|uniref:Uncharacterized protein n=1 Tax=Microdochium trichocladiopsis TaxID=1682393 RepID=A0A9P9BJ66_9PEZI|nr:uncharacterized protein B0I36DRAFT_49287 [Microdochium trichocladiopsis]KAH7014326.1 hypothetical protein B0I36DRAFT_49287 [Microdochium trichocladiopsis]